VLLPVQLAAYHRQVRAGQTLNSRVTLRRKADGWWLTLSYEEDVAVPTSQDAPVIGVDVGSAHFLTTSTAKHYGTFQGKLAERHTRDREKHRRTAKLRAGRNKKAVERLPSTRNAKVARCVCQEIKRAVNELCRDHPDAPVAYEHRNGAGMRLTARRMNAYLDAANFAHIPQQLAWGAAKRGIRARTVTSAYSSQDCHRCHPVARENRPSQQTVCCRVCGHTTHADGNAAENLASRLGDLAMMACADRAAVKVLLAGRHQNWLQNQRLAVVQPPAYSQPQKGETGRQ
jgi:transposase